MCPCAEEVGLTERNSGPRAVVAPWLENPLELRFWGTACAVRRGEQHDSNVAVVWWRMVRVQCNSGVKRGAHSMGAYRALCTRCVRAVRKVGHSPPPVGSFLGVGLPQGTIAIVYPCSINPPPSCVYVPFAAAWRSGKESITPLSECLFFFGLLSFNSSVHISTWTWIPRLRVSRSNTRKTILLSTLHCFGHWIILRTRHV